MDHTQFTSLVFHKSIGNVSMALKW